MYVILYNEGMVSMNYYELALQRRSTRSFKTKKVSPTIINQLHDYVYRCRALVDDAPVQWRILTDGVYERLAGCAGYHGFMVEAPCYLLLLAQPEPWYLENAGFMGEDMVLKLTEMELASCWITIQDPDELKRQLDISTSMVPAALIAFGYEKPVPSGPRIDIKSPSNIALKQRSGQEAPKLYLDDAVFDGDWGVPAQTEYWNPRMNLYQALIAACCAPTALNRQPFRFILDDGQAALVILPDDLTSPVNARLNTGIVMHHFASVMQEKSGRMDRWNLTPPNKKYKIPEGAVIAGTYPI